MNLSKEEQKIIEKLRADKEKEKENQENKKIEFSKLIFYFVTMFIVILTLFSFVMIFKTNDLSPLSYLIPAWFSEFGIATGFYYNKAKAENIIKLKKIYKLNSDDISDLNQ